MGYVNDTSDDSLISKKKKKKTQVITITFLHLEHNKRPQNIQNNILVHEQDK